MRTITQARLEVTLSEDSWTAEISSAHPETNFSVLAVLNGTNVIYVLIRITATAGNVGTVLRSVTDHPGIFDAATARENDYEATVQCDVSAFDLLTAAKYAGVPVETPIDVADGVATFEIAGSHDRFSAFGERLDELGMGFDIKYVQRRCQSSRVLTDTQRELLLAAVELGYYDTPRGCTQEEIAEELEVAKSTCSGVLHRAEEAIVKEYVTSISEESDEVPKRVLQ
jgi:predicted DNA binding protein